ncbi:MAG: class I SAM-dependent methyltransferase [Nitrospinota bacterium]
MNLWDAQYERGDGLRFWPNEDLVRFIGRHYGMVELARPEKVLEIGCGNGANLWFLAELGFDVTGLDSSWKALQLADQRLCDRDLSASLHYGDMREMKYESDSFDLVADVMAMQHLELEDHLPVYREIIRVLKPGGRVFSYHLAEGSDYQRIFPTSGPACLIRQQVLRQQLEKAGFTQINMEQTSRTYESGSLLAVYHVVEAQR